MKGIVATSLAASLGIFTVSGYAEEVVWRAVKGAPPRPAAPAAIACLPPAPLPEPISNGDTQACRLAETALPPPPAVVVASQAVNASAPNDGVQWLRVRAKGEDAVPPAGTAIKGVPVSGAPVASGPISSTPVSSGPVSNVPLGDCGGSGQYFAPLEGMDMPLYAVTGAPRLQLSAEFLAWRTSPMADVPLLTTFPPGNLGLLPGAPVVVSTADLDDRNRYGLRLGGVYWLDCCASYGIDARYFFTGSTSRNVSIDSGTPPGNVTPLFRPFTAAVGNGLFPFSETVAFPFLFSGTFEASGRSEFWGAEVNYRDNLCCGCNYRLDLIAGFRYLNLDENLTAVERVLTLQTEQPLGFPAGTRRLVIDRFDTDNDFYGGQIGAVTQFRRDRWTLDVRASVALGVTQQELNIDGSTTLTLPNGLTAVAAGGLLALNSNIGHYTRDEFSVVPEVGINVGYQVNDHLRTFVGYNYLYWTNVVRPADQIDTVINPYRIPFFLPPGGPTDPARPSAQFRNSDFWAQGITAGFEYRW